MSEPGSEMGAAEYPQMRLGAVVVAQPRPADLGRRHLSDCQVTLSVGRKGQCWDNAVAESFFASLKGELIDTRAWPTRTGACRAV